MTVRWPLLVAALAAAGCGGGDSGPDAATPEESPAAQAPAPAPAAADPWAVTPMGIGPLRVGASLDELLPRLVTPVDSAALAGECGYARAAGAPDSVLLMIQEGRLARVDVTGGATATAEGARVGDPEARIEQLYPGVRRGPHKYTDGSYLVALPGAPADTVHRIVFETDGTRVTRYRAGTMPEVEWVEGCA